MYAFLWFVVSFRFVISRSIVQMFRKKVTKLIRNLKYSIIMANLYNKIHMTAPHYFSLFSRAHLQIVFLSRCNERKKEDVRHSCHQRHLRTSTSRAWSREGRSIVNYAPLRNCLRPPGLTRDTPCSWHVFEDDAKGRKICCRVTGDSK